MTLVAFTDCCGRLGIDAKTLRNWLRQANLAWTAHPKDARLKCLTTEQVERLARLHDRPLPSTLSALPHATPAKPESEAQVLEASLHLPASSAEADLRKQLSCLETKMAVLQEQLAGLALCLLNEREGRYEQRLRALEALLPRPLDPPACPPPAQAPVAKGPPHAPSAYGRPLHGAAMGHGG